MIRNLKLFVILFLTLGFMLVKNVSASEVVIIDTSFCGHRVLLEFTNKPVKGTILLLQGWNFPPNDWCQHSDICTQALERGYNLVMPDMGKSIYHSQTFKETRVDWLKYPTRKWLVDSLIPQLQIKAGLFVGKENFVIGLSTGARGAVLVAMDRPDLFKGVAALSGDYDQTTMPNDNLCKGYYGNYKRFKKRWKTIDNPYSRIIDLKTPIYLGHGLKDKVVPYAQTILFYKELKKRKPTLKTMLSTPENEHNYQFWANEVDSIFTFFGII
jgi:S-formylglutathione hydrolase FrmB